MRREIATIGTGIRTLIYVFLATLAFLMLYPMFQAILDFEMSPIARITIYIVFWLACFTVVYMGAYWTYTKKEQQTP